MQNQSFERKNARRDPKTLNMHDTNRLIEMSSIVENILNNTGTNKSNAT